MRIASLIKHLLIEKNYTFNKSEADDAASNNEKRNILTPLYII